MFLLNDNDDFPDVDKAGPDGLLAIGGDLSVPRLINAYRKGIFPWYNEDEPILWWCPDPRFVLYPADLKISRSMKAVTEHGQFKFTINTDFEGVIESCKTVVRKGQEGTWISAEIKQAYVNLHNLGLAESAEAWLNGKLVGGLYGIRLGNIFFGESMFSRLTNASKFAFIHYARHLQQHNVQLIDCQVYTAHLESLGAKMISREKFIGILEKNIL